MEKKEQKNFAKKSTTESHTQSGLPLRARNLLKMKILMLKSQLISFLVPMQQSVVH
jgi:hypothetical protein